MNDPFVCRSFGSFHSMLNNITKKLLDIYVKYKYVDKYLDKHCIK